MANIEDRDLEDILVKTEAPKRVKSGENVVKKVAKLTGRTISSLRTKIKENRLDKAYAKYNKKYQKMKEAAKVAVATREAKDAGEDITNSELAVEYSIVASYDKKLAKLGAKLLKEDIKKVAAGIDVSDKVFVGKRIKIPRFLLTKMEKLIKAVEKSKVKKEEKKLVKEMTKQTREYIKTSLDGALFKEDGSLQDKIDPEVIKNLGLKGGKNDTERRLDTLKGFISMDGKTALFENKDEVEDELEKESKSNTDLPPSKPEATVEKGEEKVNVDDLLKGFAKKEALTDKKELTVPEKTEENKLPVVFEEKTPEKNTESRQEEVDSILRYNNRIEQLEETLKKSTDPEVREIITKEKERVNQELESFVNNLNLEKNKKNNDKQQEDISTVIVEEPSKVVEQENKEKTMEPIVVTENKEESANEVMSNVEVKNPEQIRVSQIAKPAALRVTLQDIKKLEERNRDAQLKIAQLKTEKENLEKDKAMLEKYIAQANITRQAEMQAKSMAESNALLKGEIAELNSKASEINIDLGRSK